MANEASKDFNAMLRDGKDMPKVQTLDTTLSVKDYYACVSTRCIVI